MDDSVDASMAKPPSTSEDKASLDTMDLEMEDLNSASRRLIDSHYAFQNDILSSSIPSILGYKLRQMYLEQKLEDAQYHLSCDNPEHQSESFRFYCRDCASKICTLCLVAHEGHDVISHAAAVDEKFDNLAGAVSQFGDIQVSLEKAMETGTSRRELLVAESAALKESVIQKVSELHARLDQLRDALCSAVDAAAKPVLSEHDATLESWRTYKEMVRPQAEMRNDLAACLRSDNLFKLEEKTRMKLMEAKRNIPSLKPPERVRLRLRWNEKTLALLSDLEKFGEVCLEPTMDPFQRMASFSARHVLDKAPTCIEGLACCDNGCLVVSDSANLKVKVFAPDGRVVRCFVGGGQYQLAFPGDVVPTAGGGVLVCDPGDNKAVLFGENGMGRSLLPCHSCDCAFAGRDGEIGVVDSLYKVVEWLRVTPQGKLERSRPESVQLQHMGLLAKPRFALLNPVSGCLFVIDPFEHCCFVFSEAGAFMKKQGRQGHSFGEFSGPGAPACDPAGQVLVPDCANHRVHLLDACGSFVRYALTAADGLQAPRACCFDTSGHLWVAQTDGQLRQFAYA